MKDIQFLKRTDSAKIFTCFRCGEKGEFRQRETGEYCPRAATQQSPLLIRLLVTTIVNTLA
jgi:hypothetical protein